MWIETKCTHWQSVLQQRDEAGGSDAVDLCCVEVLVRGTDCVPDFSHGVATVDRADRQVEFVSSIPISRIWVTL